MSLQPSISRRTAVKSSLFGLLAVSLPSIIYAEKKILHGTDEDDLFYRYPAIKDDIVSEVVGASHFDLDRVKELVDKRPELARATWDWGFGDWETAIGAASHVGRKDIVAYLMEKGARPDIFTFAMLGAVDVVKSMIVYSPGIQRTYGPHGISLLQHAKSGSRSAKDEAETSRYDDLILYLETLGDAGVREEYLDLPEDDQKKFLGDYKYGDGPNDGFTIQLNMRKLLSLGKIGKFGGALYRTGENTFTYNGAPSVEISFLLEEGVVKSLTIHEPDLILTAKKV